MTATVTTPQAEDANAPQAIAFGIAGHTLAMRAVPVKDKPGRVYYVLTKGKNPGRDSLYGVPAPKLSDELPTSVTIEGVTVHLDASLTGKPEDEAATRRPQRRYQGPVDIPTLEGTRVAKVVISTTKDGEWNITATLRRNGEGKGGASLSHEARMANLASLEFSLFN